MKDLFEEMSQKIKIYFAVETTEDPYEKNVSLVNLPYLSISAMVSDLSFSKAQWTMPGIIASDTKEIIIENRHENIIKLSQQIEINNVLYEGWKINGYLQYKREGNYIRLYIYKKQV